MQGAAVRQWRAGWQLETFVVATASQRCEAERVLREHLRWNITAYLLVDLDIHDPEGFQEYRSKVPEFIAKRGGEYLVAGGEFEVIEGDWQPHRLALFKFPDRQSIRNFFIDPDFAEVAAVRRRSSKTTAVAIDGLD